MDKNTIISNLFYDPSGFGSIKNILKEAKQVDPKITYQDVKQWKEQNIERKTNLRGFNSFIVSEPLEEFQIDLMFFSDLKDKEYPGGLLLVDIFTKFTTVQPIKSKQIPDVLEALKKAITYMGKPKTIYSDDEGAFVSNVIQKYFKDNDIRHIITRTHAPVAERQIRTIKDMIYKRIDKTDKRWVDVLPQALITYNYKNEHSTTGMTPAEAKKPGNLMTVKLKLELNRKRTRKYPEIKVGDKVKIYKKKDKMDKERVSVWSDNAYEVESIRESMGQQLFKISGRERPLLRHEILLVS